MGKKANTDHVSFLAKSLHLNKCQAHHFGPWMIEPEWLRNAVDAISRGIWKAEGITQDAPDGDGGKISPNSTPSFQVVDGVAVIPISGAMMKARSKYGGTSTVDARNQIRKAVNDGGINAILLHIDSPGGTMAGTDSLAGDVAAANEEKPVYAHVEDCCASAAYYIACQTQRITASNSSLIGSLGTRMQIVDSSKGAEQDGLKVYDISSGEFKGAGTPGVPITDRQIEYFQGIVNTGNQHFKQAVKTGRKLSQEQVDALFDGKVHDAQKAKALGLIDEVSTLDAALGQIMESFMTKDQFESYAAENPEAVAGYIAKGHKAGMAEGAAQERKRSCAAIEAAGDNTTLAIESVKAGHDPDTVKLAADAAAKATAKAQAEATASAEVIAAKDAEIAKLKEQVTFVQGTQGAVGTQGATASASAASKEAPEKPDEDAPVEQQREWATAAATHEWDSGIAEKKKFSTKDRYVAYRRQELMGNLRVLQK